MKRTIDSWLKSYKDLDQSRETRDIDQGPPEKGSELQEIAKRIEEGEEKE
ncbi:hypothetical protein GCM10027355_32440 [Haloplanus salinarum]|jgi:hypothetical protein